MHKLLYSGFLKAAECFPHRPALELEGRVLTYEQLARQAFRIGATLRAHANADGPPLTAVFAYRSETAFAGVLAALLQGHGYVPLNRTFPPERTRLMLERSTCRSVIVDQQSSLQLPQVLEGITRSMVFVMPETADVDEFARRWPNHRFIGSQTLAGADDFVPVSPSPDNIAYLLFTSGSTGAPKGVMVAHRNALSYLDFVVPRYGITEKDRCSQTFDMTFDLSVHDMFVTWEKGACLCCLNQKELIKPGKFIVDSRLTTWFSVPSTGVFMKKLGMLKPGMYPGLRLSLFCGEALPLEVVRGWAGAAPNSIIENIYGPTELSIACTAYRYHPEDTPGECELGVVPIGEPFAEMKAIIVDESLNEVPAGMPGELMMTGPQVTPGYWKDPVKTADAFVVPPGKTARYYRTGDRVRRPAPGKPMLYLGRIDNQIKVLGHRVELGEIEAAVREESGVDGVVAVGWPMSPSGADGIEVFLQAENLDTTYLQEKAKSRLPAYMVPRNFHLLSRFPLNLNGKFDRKALIRILETSK